ncbi:Sulfotransferase 1C2 [Hondaea fermentalgiana]|uniref:Sulfotransferase 1C2 n=1 Tax=Hondaea fermentalgiana TaxID=2315210 RepID=A0A2R5GAM1_9STRA|nr:Sulfotransferase 1C2 [Hondaea fermentalgiana]|eukprot:GBG28076.1 Sulfotransferase 1C2 [Hondaea fermentalgiana]
MATRLEARQEDDGTVNVVDRTSGKVEGSFEPAPRRKKMWNEERAAFLAAQLRFRDDDVVLATFPKCGTTVAEQMILLLLNNCDTSVLNPGVKNIYNSETGFGKVWPEVNVFPAEDIEKERADRIANRGPDAKPGESEPFLTPEDFDKIPGRRVLKSHFNADDVFRYFPHLAESKAKLITVSRDPLDACVSTYCHLYEGQRNYKPKPTMEEFVPIFLGGASWDLYLQPYGRLSDAITSFEALHKRDPERALLLTYDEIVRDPVQVAFRIAKHLNVECSQDLADRVAEATRFGKMKAQSGDAVHFRQGKVGGDNTAKFAEYPGLATSLREQHAKQLEENRAKFQ